MNRQTQQKIEALRSYFGTIATIEPNGPFYDRIVRILETAPIDAVKAAADADIKFVSVIARNQLRQRTH